MRESIYCALLLFPLVAACASGGERAESSAPAAREVIAQQDTEPSATQVATSDWSPGTPLSEPVALGVATELRPELSAASARIEAAAARVRAAGRMPNPTLWTLAQGIPLDSTEFNSREYYLGVTQGVPIGGRLDRAVDVAERELEAAAADAVATAFRISREVRGAFATAVYSARATALASEGVFLAEEHLALANARLEAGDPVPAEVTAFELVLVGAQAEERRAASLDERARAALASALGITGTPIESVEGDLESTLELPELEALLARIEESPELLAASARSRAAVAEVELARARRVPDLQLNLAYHRIGAIELDSLNIGLAIDVPVFDSGSARVAGRHAEMLASRAMQRESRLAVETDIRGAHHDAVRALELLHFQDDEVLPRTERWVETVRARYQLGDVSRAELLRARRAHLTARLSALEFRRDLMAAWARLAGYLALTDSHAPDTLPDR